jgi:hypothetical protein
MTTYGIRINNQFVAVALKGVEGIKLLNPLILIVPKHVTLENDNMSTDITCVGDLHKALSKQYINKPTDILREDTLTNELE